MTSDSGKRRLVWHFYDNLRVNTRWVLPMQKVSWLDLWTFFYQFAQMCGRRRRGRDVKAYEPLESQNIQNMESDFLINSDNSILSWLNSYSVDVSIGWGDYFLFTLLFQDYCRDSGLMTFNMNYRIILSFSTKKKDFLRILKGIALKL